MNLSRICLLVAASVAAVPARAEATRELIVHLAQANNDSPYTFVRAKFRPGEVAEPWHVRFFDDKGKEVPCFVWDSITWRTARDGRTDWGSRYALLNHGVGDDAKSRIARTQKIEWAKKNLPELGARLQAAEEAETRAPDSVCAALYLLRFHVPAMGKAKLTLRLDPKKQADPTRAWKGEKVEKRVDIRQGILEFRGMPDELVVFRDGKEVFHHAGFSAGGVGHAASHVDPSRPFSVKATEGLITKVAITGQTKGRADGTMDWKCTYWLLPEGSFVGLEGFSMSNTEGYRGGPQKLRQKLSLYRTDGNFSQRHVPDWGRPWWLHQAAERGFVATHLFHATPLAIGFGNNPFAVNAEGRNKDPKVEADGRSLFLTWSHRIDDPAIARLMVPRPRRRPNDPSPKEEPKPTWKPKTDWLYRQYVCGLGDKEETAEGALRSVLGAAAGWIDRPVSEEAVATRLVQMMPKIATRGESAELGLLKIVPAVLKDDPAGIAEALRRARDPVERTDYYIKEIRRHVALGGRPSEGRKMDPKDGSFHEGWTGNPCYHAALMPCYLRVLQHFDLRPERRKAYADAVVRYADFTLDLLGGNPVDYDKLGTVFRSEWPSRIVPVIPLMLHAHTVKADDRYLRAVKIQFQDLTRLVERNPHGYFPVWTWDPKAAPYDTVYNPMSYERGIAALWSEGRLDVVGREQASRFVAAQARWFVFSGQLLDTLEIDNPTAIRATQHGGHTELRNQVGIYLHDDFAFYRGLVADLVDWSAASCQVPPPVDDYGVGPYRSLELSNAGSSMIHWALSIRPGSSWNETKLQKRKDGFTLQAWNRKPAAKPTVKVAAKDAGLKGDADVLQVQLSEPAYRVAAEFDVSWTADRITIKVSRPGKVRLDYAAIVPGWTAKPELRRGGDAVREVTWTGTVAEWQATAGEYEFHR